MSHVRCQAPDMSWRHSGHMALTGVLPERLQFGYRGKEVVRLDRFQYGQWRYQRVRACPRTYGESPSQRRGLALRAAGLLADRPGAPLPIQRWSTGLGVGYRRPPFFLRVSGASVGPSSFPRPRSAKICGPASGGAAQLLVQGDERELERLHGLV